MNKTDRYYKESIIWRIGLKDKVNNWEKPSWFIKKKPKKKYKSINKYTLITRYKSNKIRYLENKSKSIIWN